MPDGTGAVHDRRQDAGRRHLEAGEVVVDPAKIVAGRTVR